MHTYIHTRTCTKYIYNYIHTLHVAHTRVQGYIHAHTQASNTHTHTHTHIYIHTHTHIQVVATIAYSAKLIFHREDQTDQKSDPKP